MSDAKVIYNLVLDENHSTFFEIKDDGFLYLRNCSYGKLSHHVRYVNLLTISSNQIIKKNPQISPDEWGKEYEKQCMEYLDDIAELPTEYKLKVADDMDLFRKTFIKTMAKKTKVMKKAGLDESVYGNRLEGVNWCLKTGKQLCYTCSQPKKLLQCSRCCNISYCSKECSHADWKRHKKNCLPVAK